MNPITLQLSVTLDANSTAALIELLTLVVEKAIGRRTQAAVTPTEHRSAEEKPLPKPKMTPVEASQNALFAGQRPPEDQGLLIDSRQASKLLRISSRTLWSMYNSRRMPAPIRIGRAIRWSYEELRAWVNEGCPAQEKWEWPK